MVSNLRRIWVAAQEKEYKVRVEHQPGAEGSTLHCRGVCSLEGRDGRRS